MLGTVITPSEARTEDCPFMLRVLVGDVRTHLSQKPAKWQVSGLDMSLVFNERAQKS